MGGYLPSVIGGVLLLNNVEIPVSGTEIIIVNSSGQIDSIPNLTWSAVGFSGNLAATDDTLQKIFDKVDDFNLGGLSASDINTLAKLNAIVLDATLVNINHTHTASTVSLDDAGGYFIATDVEGALQELGGAGGGGGSVGELSDLSDVLTTVPTGGQVLIWNNGSSLWENQDLPGSLQTTDINTLAKLNAIVSDATLVDISHGHNAGAISITDTGAYFIATDVEGALQELGGAGGGGAATLGQLTDVTITAPANNEALVYNTGSASWVNAAVPGSGFTKLIIYELIQNHTNVINPEEVLARILDINHIQIHASHIILDPEAVFYGALMGRAGMGIEFEGNYYMLNMAPDPG